MIFVMEIEILYKEGSEEVIAERMGLNSMEVETGMRKSHGSGIRFPRAAIVLFALIASTAFAFWTPGADARNGTGTDNFYGTRCAPCHGATPTTCNGCHHHGPSGLTASTNKTSYAAGEAITVTVNNGRSSGATVRGGWVRILLELNSVEVARSTGPTGEGGGASLPITFSATGSNNTGAPLTAPTTEGTYRYEAVWFGNANDGGSTHGEVSVYTNSFTVVAADPATKIGVFRAALRGQWYLDTNGNGVWNAGTDTAAYFGTTGDAPIAGAW